MAVTKSWKEPLAGAMATLPAKRSPVRDADPAAVAVAEAGVDLVEHAGLQLAEVPLAGQEAGRPRALGQEHVGRGPVALLVQQQGQLGRVAVLDVDGDAGLLVELLQQGPDQVLGAPGVDGQGVAVAAAAGQPQGEQGDGDDGGLAGHPASVFRFA
jgi:hypothetical protein